MMISTKRANGNGDYPSFCIWRHCFFLVHLATIVILIQSLQAVQNSPKKLVSLAFFIQIFDFLNVNCLIY